MENLIDVAAERAILSGIVQYGYDGFCEVSDIIKADSFTDDTNKVIYKCFENIFEEDQNTKPDIPLIISTAQKIGYGTLFDNIEEKKYLKAVTSLNVELTNLRKLSAIVQKLCIGRLLCDQLESAKKSLTEITGKESIGHILGLVENPIFNLQSLINNDEEIKNLGSNLEDYVDYISNNVVDCIGISTGFPLYDVAIGGGFRRKTVNLIGARTKVGKSFISLNVALWIRKNLGIPVLYLDTEMSENDHYCRGLANISGVLLDDIETGKFTRNIEDKEKVKKAVEVLKDNFYDFVNISGIPFEDTIGLMRRWVNKKVGKDINGRTKDCLIIYDYLKLMSGENINASMQEYQLLGFQATTLHNFAVKYDVPIMSLIQLNRDGITKESADTISGSDRIAWLCSNFTILKDKTQEEINEDGPKNGNKKLVILLCRHGKGLVEGDYVNVVANLEYGRMIEGKTKSELLFYTNDTEEKIEF